MGFIIEMISIFDLKNTNLHLGCHDVIKNYKHLNDHDLVKNGKTSHAEGRYEPNFDGEMVWKTEMENSEIGVHFLDQPQLLDLRSVLQECCLVYNNRAQLDLSWFNIMGKGSSIKAHMHEGSFASGAYYPYVEENSCPLMFENGVSITPQIGLLILFPGMLEHKTMPNQSEKRITVSFNCNPMM